MVNLLNFPHNLEEMMLEEDRESRTPDQQPSLNSKSTMKKNGKKIKNEVKPVGAINVKGSNLIPWI